MASLRIAFVSLLASATLFSPALAADCTTATVGSPYSTCYDIAVAAKINTDQLVQYNPGLNCGALQLGQKLCVTVGNLPSSAPKPNADGSCATYTTQDGDYCALIGTKFAITAAQIEQFNVKTYKWKGCGSLAKNYTLCVSSGTPPPIPVNPSLQCGPESPGAAECPLKACCSAFGFCGITSEFCDAAPNGDPCISNCGYAKMPSCDGSQLTRKVGYYAGWSAKRACNAVQVSQLDLTGLTHVIYAFAVITDSMGMAFLDSTDGDRLKELVTKAGSTTKVTVAVGGWTFSQGASKDIFSTMIGSSANRAKFIAAAKSFISTYGLAGIDIDFEYPASVERGGPPSDTPNLTAFFKELRAGLGSGAVISLATPAGYWFLKGFEMDKIAPQLSFINVMSYDYHGPWDTTVKGANSTAQPQSSILDMKDSVLLYVKAGVDMKLLNLGLAWYGRTYKLSDSDCKGYNCDMTAGGTKGPCSGEAGVLANFEVVSSMVSAEARPVYDKNSETKWFNTGGDLVTYDDEDTWAAKTKFAKDTCFGGTMIWSLDQVMPKNNANPGNGVALHMNQVQITNKWGATWEEPEAKSCKSYGNRIYSARLWNIPSGASWEDACYGSPISIKGVTYSTPDSCQVADFIGIGLGVWGTWVVASDDSHCKPHWGDTGSNGCTSFGKSEKYARLWDVASGESWMTLCRTAPITIDGKTFDKPQKCDDKGILGAYGLWEVDDPSCKGTWGDLKDNGCSSDKKFFGRREWSSKLFDIAGSWEDSCNARENTVGDEYFSTPTKCEKHITGIWGVWMVQDTSCGVPPCPSGKTWDYHANGCMGCDGKSRLMNRAMNITAVRHIDSDPHRHSGRRSSAQHARHARANALAGESLYNMTAVTRTLLERSLDKRAGNGCDAFFIPRPNPGAFDQLLNTWSNEHAGGEGAAASQIVAANGVLRAFQEAWDDSFPTSTTAREVGGWIYQNPTNGNQIVVRRANSDRATTMHQTRPGAQNAGIDLNNPGSSSGRAPPAGWIMVANFHTHPFGASYGSDAPSTADQMNAWTRGIPGIIITRRGIFTYGPPRRAQLSAPRDYPNGNEDWGGQNAEGTRVGTWTPTRHRNQQE